MNFEPLQIIFTLIQSGLWVNFDEDFHLKLPCYFQRNSELLAFLLLKIGTFLVFLICPFKAILFYIRYSIKRLQFINIFHLISILFFTKRLFKFQNGLILNEKFQMITVSTKYTYDYEQLWLIPVTEISLHKGKMILTDFQGKLILAVGWQD